MLKYPILLIHGMGFRDNKYLNYWGRIPDYLESIGCKVFYGYQDSNASIEDNAEMLKKRIDIILKNENISKLNVIAHSKGGLDMRYAISSLGVGKNVASLTTLATPHNGSKTIDKIMLLPKVLLYGVFFVCDLWMRFLGDKKPNTYKVVKELSTVSAKKFNEKNEPCIDTYYQSYGFIMKNALSDIFLTIPYIFVYLFEGKNDGLLSPQSTVYGDFKGIVESNSNRGISHCDEVDMRRRKLTKVQGRGQSDILDLYKDIVIDLYKKGF